MGDIECRCGLVYDSQTVKKTRGFICAECGQDLREKEQADDQ